MIVHVGDRVLLHSFDLYRGESLPDIPATEYTGEVISAWGIFQRFYKVRRDHDGRVIPVMEKDIHSVIARAETKKKRR